MTKSESQSTIVLTVDDARLARSVAVRWHRAREGLQKTGSTPADGAEGVTAQPAGYRITYNFITDPPSTFNKYHARVGRDRAAGLVDARGSKAWPSDGRRERTAAGHGVVNVPPSDQKPTSGSHAGTTIRRADRRTRRRRDVASAEAQLMANCRVMYSGDTKYDGCPPVRRFLRWAGAALTAVAVLVSGICGPRDEVASATAQLMAGCPVIQYDDTEYDSCPPARRLLRCATGICDPARPRWALAVEQGRG